MQIHAFPKVFYSKHNSFLQPGASLCFDLLFSLGAGGLR